MSEVKEEKPKFEIKLYCNFCSQPQSNVRYLYRSKIGGIPSCICDQCVIDCAIDLGLVPLPTSSNNSITNGKEHTE